MTKKMMISHGGTEHPLGAKCKVCERAREEFSTPTKVFLKMLDEKEEYQLSSIPLQLKKLGNADGVKLSSTLVGQRVLIRQHRNKINEIEEE